MAKQVTVEELLDQSSHPRKAEIEEIRSAILGSSPEITEQVKWNAPSFCIGGDDRITFLLQPGDRVGLVFHRGTRKRTDTDTFEFQDPTGLIEWSTPERGVVTFADHDDVRTKLPDVLDLVTRWMAATAD